MHMTGSGHSRQTAGRALLLPSRLLVSAVYGVAEVHYSPWLPHSPGQAVPTAMTSALSRLCSLRPARELSEK